MENTELKYVAFYRSYYDTLRNLPNEIRLAMMDAIFDYGFTGIEPTFTTPELNMAWGFVKPNVISNIKTVIKNQENGKKGGRPKKELNNQEQQRVNQVIEEKKETIPQLDVNKTFKTYTEEALININNQIKTGV